MKPSMNFAIVVAAGKGLRMGTEVKKQYLCLGRMPILAHTLMVFDKSPATHEIILVVPEEDLDVCREKILAPYAFQKKIHLVAGGDERQHSVLRGLKCIQDFAPPRKKIMVMIHDGVRPFVTPCIIDTCLEKALAFGACIPGVKVTDTLKAVRADFVIQKTVDRDMVYQAQTPQIFEFGLILNAVEHARKTAFLGTDDASLVENYGHKVHVVEGARLNIKITTPEDLVLGELLLAHGLWMK